MISLRYTPCCAALSLLTGGGNAMVCVCVCVYAEKKGTLQFCFRCRGNTKTEPISQLLCKPHTHVLPFCVCQAEARTRSL